MRVTNAINNRFQEDYKKIKERIDRIPSPADKESLGKLLNGLASAVSDIESAHEAALFGNTSKIKSIGDNRERVAALRKQIEQRLAALNV